MMTTKTGLSYHRKLLITGLGISQGKSGGPLKIENILEVERISHMRTRIIWKDGNVS